MKEWVNTILLFISHYIILCEGIILWKPNVNIIFRYWTKIYISTIIFYKLVCHT